MEVVRTDIVGRKQIVLLARQQLATHDAHAMSTLQLKCLDSLKLYPTKI